MRACHWALAAIAAFAGCVDDSQTAIGEARHAIENADQTDVDESDADEGDVVETSSGIELHHFKNASGKLRTFTTAGTLDFSNPFFQSIGTNGRTCNSCHKEDFTGQGEAARLASQRPEYLVKAMTD